MALDPNVVVVAPLELITATHLNNVRANLDRIDQLATRSVETRTTTLALSGAGLTTSPSVVPNALTTGTRGYDRLILVTAGILVSGAAGALDLYLRSTGVTAGTVAARRTRYTATMSGFLAAVFHVASGVAATVTAELATSTGTATVTTVGGADLNYLNIQMIPAGTLLVIP